MQTIPRNAMSVQSRGQSCLYVSVGFGYNGGWRWPTEIEHDGEFWTYRGNQALPAEQANNWGGYAEYRRAFRAIVEQTSTPIDVREVVPVFKVLRRFGDFATLVEARPITGRTHQIRVHAKHAGHAIAGDPKYGDEDFSREIRELGGKRLFLHAAQLRVPLPDGQVLELEAPVDEMWQRSLERLND